MPWIKRNENGSYVISFYEPMPKFTDGKEWWKGSVHSCGKEYHRFTRGTGSVRLPKGSGPIPVEIIVREKEQGA